MAAWRGEVKLVVCHAQEYGPLGVLTSDDVRFVRTEVVYSNVNYTRMFAIYAPRDRLSILTTTASCYLWLMRVQVWWLFGVCTRRVTRHMDMILSRICTTKDNAAQHA